MIIKNDNKCFLWCHIRHLNPFKTHLERMTIADKNMVNDLDYEGVQFHLSKKDFRNIENKKNICINVYSYENKVSYPVYVLEQ